LNQRDVESGKSSRGNRTHLVSFWAFLSNRPWSSSKSTLEGDNDQSRDHRSKDDSGNDPICLPGDDQPISRPKNDEKKIFLLLCDGKGNATKLLQPNICQVKSDEELFKLMRKEYKSLCCNPWWPLLSFCTLTGFRFVRLKLWKRKQDVEILKKDDLPPPEKVGCEYHYAPVPPDLIPPVGEKRLLHLFRNPDCAEEELDIFHLFPKRLNEKLAFHSQGWGINPEYGWNQKKVWIVAFVIFALGSAVFGILWTMYGSGIQDAFTIASYTITLGVVTIGFAQAIGGDLD
jgi:hypothetical protein